MSGAPADEKLFSNRDDERLVAWLEHALARDVPYRDRRSEVGAPGIGSPAGVLVLLGWKSGELCLLVTQRTESVDHHKGQMAFPGGRAEPDELSRGDLRGTALRETTEEVGIPPEAVRVVGEMPVLGTVTGFRITPVVGLLKTSVESVPLTHNHDEIAQSVWVPLSLLLRAGTYRRETIEAGPIRYPIHVFQVESYRIWGATGTMIKNLLERLGFEERFANPLPDHPL